MSCSDDCCVVMMDGTCDYLWTVHVTTDIRRANLNEKIILLSVLIGGECELARTSTV